MNDSSETLSYQVSKKASLLMRKVVILENDITVLFCKPYFLHALIEGTLRLLRGIVLVMDF